MKYTRYEYSLREINKKLASREKSKQLCVKRKIKTKLLETKNQNCFNMNLVRERVKQISVYVMLYLVPRRKPQKVDNLRICH